MNKKMGFTLIELMAVIAIIAILATTLVPSISAYIERAKIVGLEEDLRKIKNASLLIKEDIGEYAENGTTIWSKNYKGNTLINLEETSNDPITQYVQKLSIPFGGSYVLCDDHQRGEVRIDIYTDKKISNSGIKKLENDLGDSFSVLGENAMKVVITTYDIK